MRAYVSVRGDASQLAGDLNAARPGIESAAQALGNRVTGILSMIGVGFGVGAFVSQGRMAVAAAEEAINSQQRLAMAVKVAGDRLGFTTEQLVAYADERRNATNIEDEAIKNSMARLMTFKNVTKEVFKRTMDSAMDLSAMGFGSVESASLMLGRALENPARGMMFLRRAGVIFSESQQQQIKLFMETGQLLQAQSLILDVVKSKVGGVAAEMRKTPAGELKAAHVALGELREELGTKLIPTAKVFVQIQQDFQKVLINVADSLGIVSNILGNDMLRYTLEVTAAVVALTTAIKALQTAMAMMAGLQALGGAAKVAGGAGAAGAAVNAGSVAAEAAMAAKVAAAGTGIGGAMNIGQGLAMSKMMKSWSAADKAALGAKAAVGGLGDAVSNYGVREAATARMLTATGMAGYLRFGLYGAVIAAELYLTKFFRDQEEEYNKLTKQNEQPSGMFSQFYKGRDIGKTDEEVTTGKSKEQLENIKKQQEAMRDLATSVYDAKNKSSDMTKELRKFREMGLVGEDLRKVIGQLRELEYSKADETTRKIAQEAMALRDGLSAAQVELAKFVEENPELLKTEDGWRRIREQQQALADKSEGEVIKSLRDLRDEVMDLEKGYDDAGIAARKLWREHPEARKGLMDEYADELRRKKTAEDKRQEQKTLESESKTLQKSLETPLEKYAQDLTRIAEMVKANLLSPEMAERATAKARKDASDAFGKDLQTGTMGAMDYGKKIQDALLKSGSEKLMEKQLSEQQGMNKGIQELPDKMAAKLNNVGGLGP